MPFQNGQRFTIYDALESAGVFSANPANAGARKPDGTSLYKGPVEYPKMMYFPQQVVIVPASAEVGSLAGQYSGMSLNEQKALKDRIVNDAEEEEQAVSEGWVYTPIEAIEGINEKRTAKGLELIPVPPVSSAIRVTQLGVEKDKVTRELADAQRRLLQYEEAEALRAKKLEDEESLAGYNPDTPDPQAPGPELTSPPQPLLKGNAKARGLV